MSSAASKARPRVCACVLMNHPFPSNLPILRRLYEGRFSEVLFLVPFLRLPDEDVITVYRGPYFHGGFLTDAQGRLAEVDCDYFLVLHDDILLNPRIDEDTFHDYFPLGPDDGFFPVIGGLPHRLRDWSWYAGMIPRLFHPKSFLFGSGIELETLRDYLPDAALLRDKLASAGVGALETLSLKGEGGHELTDLAAYFLFHGVGGRLPPNGPEQAPINQEGARAVDALLSAMDRAVALKRAESGAEAPADGSVDLPFPIAYGGVFTDLYILPKSRMAEYAHYMGVASPPICGPRS